jgi:hypothetical protein
MSHLWQRFLLASSLVVGLAIGVAATVFGYSNTASVNIQWSVFHFSGVPLWAVAVVPVTLILVAGTVYHWLDGLHHFSEHMRHRHRVRDLEAEVARLRAHLDKVLEMPRGERTAMPAPSLDTTPSLPPAEITSEADHAMSGVDDIPAPDEPKPEAPKAETGRKKRSRIIMEPEPEPVAAAANGADSDPQTTSKEG